MSDQQKQFKTVDDVLDLVSEEKSIDRIRCQDLPDDQVSVILSAGDSFVFGSCTLSRSQVEELKKILDGIVEFV